jgi:hypothetical protein
VLFTVRTLPVVEDPDASRCQESVKAHTKVRLGLRLKRFRISSRLSSVMRMPSIASQKITVPCANVLIGPQALWRLARVDQ